MTEGCECKDGFQFNNVSVCDDIDECEWTKCDDQAKCMNTIGSYSCQEIFSTTASTNTALATSVVTEELLTTQPSTLVTQTTLATTKDASSRSTVPTTQISTIQRPLPTSFR